MVLYVACFLTLPRCISREECFGEQGSSEKREMLCEARNALGSEKWGSDGDGARNGGMSCQVVACGQQFQQAAVSPVKRFAQEQSLAAREQFRQRSHMLNVARRSLRSGEGRRFAGLDSSLFGLDPAT